MVGALAQIGRWLAGLVGLNQQRYRGPYRGTDPALAELIRGTESSSGACVDADSALTLSAVFAGVNLYSLIVASLPLQVYRQRASGGKEVAADLRIQRLLHTQPNPEMTAVVFRRALEWNRLLGGMAYAEIVWGDDGQPLALWPLEYWRVKIQRDAQDYLYYLVDGTYRVEPRDMLAIPLVSADGVCGQSFLDWAIDSLGLGLTAQDFAGSFLKNDARPGGYLHHPNANLEESARNQMRAAWEKRHAQAGKRNVLGMTWGQWEFKDLAQQDPQKAQLIETRRFHTEEVARWLNIPPHLLRDLSRATFSNISAQQIDFLVYSLGPVLIFYEQEYDRKLCAPPSLYTKHKVEGFLRADPQARADFYQKMAGIGGLTINQILELEDLDPIGPLGDKRFVPANWMTLEAAARAGGPAPAPTDPAPPGTPAQAGTAAGGDAGPAADAPATDAPAEHKDPQAAAASGDVQGTALYGAQIASLVAIVTAVATDAMPADSAKAALRGSFPLMDVALINQIIDPIEAFKKNKQPSPAPPGGPADPPLPEPPPGPPAAPPAGARSPEG